MKENKKLLVIAILLLLITVSFTSYAIFKTQETANATMNVAKWNIEFLDDATAVSASVPITFDATDCPGNAHTANNVIAPGAYCTKVITVDANDTQVDVGWNVTAGNVVDNTGNDVTGVAVSFDVDNGTIEYDNVTRTANVTVNIAWTATDDDTVINPADTALAGGTLTVPLEFTAYQITA